MLLREIKNIFHAELDSLYGKEEVASFFYLLIEQYFQLERFVLALQPNVVIDEAQETLIFNALGQLKLEKPIQYILGTTTFMDLELKVTDKVLIPRPETEELVRWIISDLKDTLKPVRILDLGTGSGCIPIALKKSVPIAQVSAVDISTDALHIAKENAIINDVNINFLHADMLNLSDVLKLTFDIIAANPPYIRELEKKEMHANVTDYEPEIALFVPDEDPLVFYRSIVKFASAHLSRNGFLYLEINQYLGAQMVALLEAHQYKNIELRKDMYGNDRMLKAVNS